MNLPWDVAAPGKMQHHDSGDAALTSFLVIGYKCL